MWQCGEYQVCNKIHRGKMMSIPKAYGIPPNLLRAIEKMYTNRKAKVISPDGETKMFDITAYRVTH